MNNTESFKKYLKDGDICEYYILKRLQKQYPKAKNVNVDGVPFSDWDLYVPEIEKSFEIKGDYVSLSTGRLVVEIGNDRDNGRDGRTALSMKPTALSVTKADYWVFVTGRHYIWVTPLQIYRFINLYRPYSSEIVGNGDNYVKYVHFLDYGHFISYVKGLDDKGCRVEEINPHDPLFVSNFNKTKENFKE